MKTKKFFLLVLLALCALHSLLLTARAQGTAFTYQGLLNSGIPPVPANGLFNMKFLLFLDATGDNPAGAPPYSNVVHVVNGGFIAQIDFGPNVFTGTAYWMEIQVEQVAPNPDSSYTTLTPLVPVTPTPSAIYATTAGNFTGNVSVSQLPPAVVIAGESNVTLSAATVSGTFSGNASGLVNLNGLQVVSVGNGNPLPSGPGSPPTFSDGNFFIGPSGNGTTTGSDNTAVGDQALLANTSGDNNTAIGYQALATNNSSDNTAVGYQALYSNTSGDNTAVGSQALYHNKSGFGNTANGSQALLANTTGSYNTANGSQALFQNTSGDNNTATGFEALYDQTSGDNNTAYGVNALFANSGGLDNIALGYEAGFFIRGGSSNIDIGNEGSAGDNNLIRIGSAQTTAYIAGVITGNGAGLSNLTVSAISAAQLTSVGNADGGSGNFFVGPSGNSTTTGDQNTAIGQNALIENTTGRNNTAIGDGALSANKSGVGNTATGEGALSFNSNGSNNTANGFEALYSNTGGDGNTAHGIQALYLNTSGAGNTAIGSDALYFNASGSENTAIGDNALLTLGASSGGGGTNNIALGYQAGSSYLENESGNIDIGNYGSQGENNTIHIGTPGVHTNTFIAGAVGLGNVTSPPNAQLQVVDTGTGAGGNFTGETNGVSGYATGGSGGANGVYGQTQDTSGAGVYAAGASSSSPGLTIGQGTLRVAGAGVNTSTAAFVHVTTTESISILTDGSQIDNPACNGNPNAILTVTYSNFGNAGVIILYNHVVGLTYINGYWYIINQDESAMPVGLAFNVLVITP
jgi:hypothetical protein